MFAKFVTNMQVSRMETYNRSVICYLQIHNIRAKKPCEISNFIFIYVGYDKLLNIEVKSVKKLCVCHQAYPCKASKAEQETHESS